LLLFLQKKNTLPHTLARMTIIPSSSAAVFRTPGVAQDGGRARAHGLASIGRKHL
jgi:hypothetical protein